MGPPLQKIAPLYENILVGRASPPANRYGGQGRQPHQHQPFFIFRWVRKEMIVGITAFSEKAPPLAPDPYVSGSGPMRQQE